MGSMKQRAMPEVKTLPLAIKTLIIDGRKMTSAFFRQIVMDDLIDEETGEMQGVPLGFVEIHQKGTCPACWHKHILWIEPEYGLSHAIVVMPQDCEAYQERYTESRKACEHLMDAEALLLACSHRTQGLLSFPGYFPLRDSRHNVTINGQELDVSSDVYDHLIRLERARTVREEASSEGKRRISLKAQDESSLPPPHLDREAARQIQQDLADEGVCLAHPKLADQTPMPAGKYVILNRYSTDGRRLAGHTRSVKNEWLVCQVGGSETLYWRSSEHSTDSATDTIAEAIESRVGPFLSALRWLLADQASAHQIQACKKQVRTSVKESNLLMVEEDSLPDPLTVRQAYEQERQRFIAYTKCWQQNVSTLEAIDQLFIV